jgi:hypothetical protein
MGRDGPGSSLPSRPLSRRRGRIGPQPGGIGVQPEDDLRAASGDRLSEPLAEGARGAQLLTDFFRPEPAVNFGTLEAAIWIF